MSDVKTCPHCGRQLHGNAQYCMYCMTVLQPKQDITPKVVLWKKWGIVGGIVAACLLLALVVFAAFRDDGYSSGQMGKGPDKNDVKIENTVTKPSEESENGESKPAGETQIGVADPATDPSVTEHEEGKETVTDGSIPSQMPDPETEDPTNPTDPVTEPEIPETSAPVIVTSPTQPLCSHYYLAATCITPMTCTYCGDTVGTADLQAHIWKPVTSVVHHDEVGHYEEVEKSYQKTVYLCFFCGYNRDGYDSLEELREHMTVHSDAANYEWIINHPDLLADTREVWTTRTEIVWVVDEKAYDETVITGYTCTVCNTQKKATKEID